LILATDAPLLAERSARLSQELKTRLQFRIATELRIQIALGDYYEVETPSRFRLLSDRLRGRDSGVLREVRPWSSSPPPRAGAEKPAPEPVPEPFAPAPRMQRVTPSSPVRVVQMVSLGEAGARPSTTTTAASASAILETAPARPSKLLP